MDQIRRRNEPLTPPRRPTTAPAPEKPRPSPGRIVLFTYGGEVYPAVIVRSGGPDVTIEGDSYGPRAVADLVVWGFDDPASIAREVFEDEHGLDNTWRWPERV